MSTDWDILLVGAGAAGCAAAMSLPAGARALMIDRADPANGRCCGGLLAPDAQRAIARLGLSLPERVRVRPEPHLVRVHDFDTSLAQRYGRRYVNVDRAAFDAWLLARARERVAFLPHTRLVGLRRGGRAEVEVRVRSGEREERLRADAVIGADGARSAVRRLAFPDRPGPPAMLAIQVRLAASDPPTVHEVLFASRWTDFYGWAIPKEGSALVGAAFGRLRGARARFGRILETLRRLAALHGPVLAQSGRRLSRPGSGRELFGGGGPVLLAGEAAGLVSPSSGEGLSFALASGAAAGRAAGRADPVVAYGPAFEQQARRVRRKLLKARAIFSPAWRRLALRVPWCP